MSYILIRKPNKKLIRYWSTNIINADKIPN